MDAIVTARVPVETKERATIILNELGTTPSKLINDVYRYVVDFRKLPPIDTPRKGPRQMSAEMKAELEASIAACTLPEPEGGWDQRDYREVIAEGKSKDYWALG